MKFLLFFFLLISCFKKDESLDLITCDAQKLESGCLQFETKSGALIDYCIWNKQDDPKDILYAMHGILGEEQNYFYKNNNAFCSEWKETQKPMIISFSYGKTFLLTGEENSRKKVKINEVISEFIPFIEKNKKPERRHLNGVSMGGFNSLQLISRHPDFFDKVSLSSPASSLISPYSSLKEINDYAKRTGISANTWKSLREFKLKDAFINKLGPLAQSFVVSRYYFSESEWEVDSPLKFIENSNESYPDIYLGICDTDNYGFFEGNYYLKDLLLPRAKSLEVHTDLLFHGHINIQRIIEFHQR